MARYVTKVATSWSADKAFAYMADLRNFANWDPGVRKVVQVEGVGGSAASVFDVTVAGKPRDLVLTYRTVDYDPPNTMLVIAKSTLFVSEDRIRVTPQGKGCVVEYDAQLRFNGPLALADLALRPFFTRIGDRAAQGLRTALEGTKA